MKKKLIILISCISIQSHLSFANFDAKLLNYQPGPRENVVVYFPVPYSSGYFSLYRNEPVENKNIAVIAHGHSSDTLISSFKNMINSSLVNQSSFFNKFVSTDHTNAYYFSLPQLNHLFRLYSKDLKKPDGTPQYDMVLGYGYSSVGRIKELGQRMSNTLTPITSRAKKVVHSAHSMGGLVSLWALTKTGPDGLGGKGKAETLITYSSPLQGIATGLNSGSIVNFLKGHISTTDMMTMTPFADDQEKSDFLKELNDGSRGFETGSNNYFDEKLDGYCISGTRYANLPETMPKIGEVPQDATYNIGDLGKNLKEAMNTTGFLNQLVNTISTSNEFYKNTSSGLNIQKSFDYLTKDFWKQDEWDALSNAEENYFSNTPINNVSNKRMGRPLSDGLVPTYSGASFPKMWYPTGNTYGVYAYNKYRKLNEGKKYEDMTQQERALYVDAMGQKSKSFREDRSNHTFILHLNHRTIIGSDHHWDGDYSHPQMNTALDQKGNSYLIEDPQYMLYRTLEKINAKMAEKELFNKTSTTGS